MNLDIAEIKKRWQVRSVLALTIQASRTQVDLMRHENGIAQRVHSLTLPIGADAVTADPVNAGQELLALLDAAGIRERRFVVCIPPGWALTASTDVPAIDPGDLHGYLELRAEREFPIAATELRLAHHAYTLPGGKQSAMLAGVPLRKIEPVERLLETVNGHAVSLSLGLDAFLQPDMPPTLLFLANEIQVDVLVVAGGGLIALRSLPGSPTATEPAFDAVSFFREVRITLGRLPEGMREQICEARFEGTPDAAEKLLTQIGEPIRKMGIGCRLSTPEPEEGDTPSETREAGAKAAGRYLLHQPIAFEFLPPQPSRWKMLLDRFDNRRRRWVVAAAGIFVVLPILSFLLHSWTENRLLSEWEGMRSNVADLESIQHQIHDFRPWFEHSPQKLKLIESLIGAFPEQGDVWAKSIQCDEESKVTCTGCARNQAALLGLQDRLRALPNVSALKMQQMRGENPVQFSFTYQWSSSDAK